MCREKVGQHFRNALGSRYKSSTKSKRRIKEESIPRMVNSLHNIIFSSKAVKDITERLEMDIIFVDESNDDDFYEKALAANMNLLQTFKKETNLVDQFQRQFSLGQQQENSSRRTISPMEYDSGLIEWTLVLQKQIYGNAKYNWDIGVLDIHLRFQWHYWI